MEVEAGAADWAGLEAKDATGVEGGRGAGAGALSSLEPPPKRLAKKAAGPDGAGAA